MTDIEQERIPRDRVRAQEMAGNGDRRSTGMSITGDRRDSNVDPRPDARAASSGAGAAISRAYDNVVDRIGTAN